MEVINGYIKTLEDFDLLLSLKMVKKESGKTHKVYKLSYLDNKKNEVVVRLELNQKKERISFGLWNSSAMQTVKYKQFLCA